MEKFTENKKNENKDRSLKRGWEGLLVTPNVVSEEIT